MLALLGFDVSSLGLRVKLRSGELVVFVRPLNDTRNAEGHSRVASWLKLTDFDGRSRNEDNGRGTAGWSGLYVVTTAV